MAHSRQAEKRIRQTARRTEHNRARRSRVRTFVKKVEKAIESGDRALAQTALVAAQSELDRGVRKGILKRNTASRKVSRLSARVKGMTAAP